jgi:F-type H+-transporting ATPase subunit delta
LFEGKANPTTFGFLNLVIRKGREMYIPEILNEFMATYRKLKNIMPVHVVSAVPLSKEAQETIKARLIETGLISGTIELSTKVNPEIIGGFQIEFDNKLIDTSISHSLDKMRRELAINLYESKIRSL